MCLDIKCYWCWEFVHDFKSDHWTQELTTYPSNILTTAPHPYEGNRFEQCSFFLCFREGGNLSIILGCACCLDSWSWIPIEVMEIFHSPMFFSIGGITTHGLHGPSEYVALLAASSHIGSGSLQPSSLFQPGIDPGWGSWQAASWSSPACCCAASARRSRRKCRRFRRADFSIEHIMW